MLSLTTGSVVSLYFPYVTNDIHFPLKGLLSSTLFVKCKAVAFFFFFFFFFFEFFEDASKIRDTKSVLTIGLVVSL